MQQIINWNAKRAGGRITVYGVDKETGKPIRIVGVDSIEAYVGLAIATDKNSIKYELVVL